MADEHKAASALATAALMDVIGRTQKMQAAIIRGAHQDEVASIRHQVHDLIDAYLDHSTAAATHVRNIIG